VLCFTGSCILSLRSWSFIDDEQIGYLIGNGVTLVNYANEGNYDGTYANEGFNTAIIQPDTCTATQFLNFDTTGGLYGDTADSERLAAYLRSLQNGTIIAGVTISSPVLIPLTDNAKSALLAIGVDPYQIGDATKVVFVATIGQPTFTKVNYDITFGNNLEMTAGVPCTYTNVFISMIVCFQSITILQLNSV